MYEVSIIIPVYNVAEYVSESLLSALNQSFESIEYVIVNDCSTDCSMDVIRRLVDAHPRKDDVFIYQQEKNYGLSSTRNLGIEHAHGKYIFFMDSDDEISKECIALHYEAITRKDADFTVGNVDQIGSRSIHIHPIDSSVETMSPIVSYYRRIWSVSAWNKLYKRIFIESNNLRFVNGIHHEDYLWSYNVATKAKSLALVKEKTYKYKIRPGSITTIVNGDLKIKSMLFVISTISEDGSKNTQDKNKFLGFIGFNTALYILNYKGTRSRRYYYKELRKITPPRAVHPHFTVS